MHTLVNERELGFIDILKEGSRIFLFKIKAFSLIALVALIPWLILLAFTQSLALQPAQINGIKIVLLILLLLIIWAVQIIAWMSIAFIVEKVVKKRDASAIEAIKYSGERWARALTTNLLASVIIFGMTLLFVIPGIVYSNYYIFVLYVVALRDKYGKDALDYSKSLVEGQWWRVFGISLGISVIVSGISFLLSKISYAPYSSYSYVTSAISFLLGMAINIMMVVLFLNNDFVNGRKLARRREREKSRRINKAPTIQEYLESSRKMRSPSRTSSRRTSNNISKKKNAAKRKSRTINRKS